MKKYLSILLCAVLLMTTGLTGRAYADVTWPSGVSIAADGGILIDAGSGTILYEKNIHEAYYPASITKILTALIILEHCDLDDTVTFTHSAVNTLEPGSSILGARVGDRMSVRDCLYALLLQSANEVANALAEHCSGSVEEFAKLMNQTAESLGCTDSNFANPSGLNDPNHYTSAHDMALIAQAAFENPAFVEIDQTLYYDVPAGQLQQYPDGWRYYAHHRMMKRNDANYYSGIIGGKTGYTSLAGNTLVTCAERDGLKLIAVVLNGHQTHYSDTAALFDFGFDHFQSVAVADKDSTYETIQNDLAIGGIASGDTVRLTVDQSSRITLPVDADIADVTSSLDYSLDDTAPANAVARIDYMYGDRVVGQAFLETSVVPGYTARTVDTSDLTSPFETNALPAEEAAGTAIDPATPELAPEEETFPIFGASESEAPTTNMDPDHRAWSMGAIVKTVLIALTGIGVLGAAIFGILAYRAKKEEEAMIIRRQNREQRRKEWGSSTDFNLVMQEHLRSKNQFRKQSLWKKLKNWFSRR